MSKPKNRRAVFTRSGASSKPAPPPPRQQESGGEIPKGSKREIRRLIEEEGASSTTEIANGLNEDGFPCASADRWRASLVDSALRRQDMEGLKEVMRENRGDDEESSGLSLLEVRQAAFDGAKEAVGAADFKGGDGTIDLHPLKVAVSETVKHSFTGLREDIEEANKVTERTLATIMNDADLASIRRVSDRTGENVGKVMSSIETATGELHNTVVGSFREHNKVVLDACENMAVQLSDQVDKRFDVLEAALVQKFTAGMDIDLDAALGKIVDDRLKAHLDEVVNRMAVMIGNMKRDLTGGNYSRGKY